MKERASVLGVLLSLPWCRITPALLSFVSVGSAAAARVAVGILLVPLFAVSVVVLGYAHYRVWVQGIGRGHRAGTMVLVVNTVLMFSLWIWRLPF